MNLLKGFLNKVIRKVFDLKQKHYNGEITDITNTFIGPSQDLCDILRFFQVRILPTNFIDKMEKTYR